jgi:predicted TIM-barrel fold metal-dependent hydrolase
MNAERVLWATDFPHSDGTYPHSLDVIEELSSYMTDTEAQSITRGNVAELYQLTL